MGNRAVITTKEKELGVYLHWNGGRDSVEAFLFYCKLKGFRAPETDCYGWARLCQVIGNWFGEGLSVGIDLYDRLDTDNGDNGVYVIENWEIIDRLYSGREQRSHELLEMLLSIDSKQPLEEQLGEEFIKSAVAKLVTPITTKQIRAIHAVIKELGIERCEYKHLLEILFKVDTCKKLSEKQASILIETLNKIKGE